MSAKVARAQQRQLEAGWRRLNLRLPPDAAQALARMEEATGLTPTAIITGLLTRRPRR